MQNATILRNFFLFLLECDLQMVKPKSIIMKVHVVGSKLSFSSPTLNYLPGSESKQGARTEKNSARCLGPWASGRDGAAGWAVRTVHTVHSQQHAHLFPGLVKILPLFGSAHSISCIQRPGIWMLLERIFQTPAWFKK